MFVKHKIIYFMGTIKNAIKKILGLQAPATKTLDSEYLHWLGYANAGMLNPGNAFCIDYAINNLPSNNPVVEIGSFCGLSTNTISFLLKKHNKTNNIITSDRWIFENSEMKEFVGESTIRHSAYRTFVMDSFKRNVQFFSSHSLPYAIEVFSDELFGLWHRKAAVNDIFGRNISLGGGISFAYIDGNHTYEQTKRDFENVDSFLDSGGFILFDDTYPYSHFGCALLMKEILANHKYKLILKNPNYLFQKI